ncbi:hypothetical protein ACRRTK_020374 [Alexandromys fortis]
MAHGFTQHFQEERRSTPREKKVVFVKIKEIKIEKPSEENTSVIKPKMKEGKEWNAEIDEIPRLILNQTETPMKLLLEKADMRQSRNLGGQKEGTFSTPYMRRLRLL